MTAKERAAALSRELFGHNAPRTDFIAGQIEAAITAAVAEERETCAKLAHDLGRWWYAEKPNIPEEKGDAEGWLKFHRGAARMLMCYEIAASIRARNNP